MGSRSGGSAAAPPVLLGLTNLSAANFAQTANPGGIAGSAAGFWIAVAWSTLAQAGSATRTLVGTLNTGVGWEFRTNGSNGTLGFYVTNGAGVAIASPLFTIPAGHVGKDSYAVGVLTATHVRLYVDDAEVGAGTAITGMTPNTNRMRVGARLTGTASATDLTFYGVAGGAGIPALADIQASSAALKANKRLGAMPNVTTQGIWNVSDVVSVLDTVGVDHMPVTGTPTLVSKPTPTWSW